MTAERAVARAGELAKLPWQPVPPRGRGFARRFAIGDPQASLATIFAILARHDLIAADGMLRDDVALLSIGDHFDWRGELAEVAEQGFACLRWLAAHPPDQVVILAGNHDLSRVTELWRVSDAAFAAGRVLADQIAAAPGDRALAERFAREFGDLPTPEVARRDYSAFTERQRDLVQALLLADRIRLADAGAVLGRTLLLTHAGVTERELAILGAAGERDAAVLAAILNDRLATAVDSVRARWSAHQPARLVLEPLHVAGTTGREGGGLLYHRPSRRPDTSDAPRRFDPRTLPIGLVQVCGHAGHHKCRGDLGDWVAASAEAVERGGLRTLRSDGARVVYEMGIQPIAPGEAGLYMIDGEMNSVAPADYALLELAGS